jgi:hypothetical protein
MVDVIYCEDVQEEESHANEKPLSDTHQYWRVMTFYERFEHIITLILSSAIRVIMVIALWRLSSRAGRSGGYAFGVV